MTQFGRYSPDIILKAWKNRTLKKYKTGQVFLIESVESDFSIEIDGFETVNTDFLTDILYHIEEFDQTVQNFCKKYYEIDFRNYKVTLEWISIEKNEATLGYFGDYVNIELIAVFKKEEKQWYIADICYA